MATFEDSGRDVSQQTSQAKEEMDQVLEEIKILPEEVKARVGEGLQGLSAAAERISGEVIGELGAFHTQVSIFGSHLKELSRATMLTGLVARLL
jgi:kinesin family protein 11